MFMGCAVVRGGGKWNVVLLFVCGLLNDEWYTIVFVQENGSDTVRIRFSLAKEFLVSNIGHLYHKNIVDHYNTKHTVVATHKRRY